MDHATLPSKQEPSKRIEDRDREIIGFTIPQNIAVDGDRKVWIAKTALINKEYTEASCIAIKIINVGNCKTVKIACRQNDIAKFGQVVDKKNYIPVNYMNISDHTDTEIKEFKEVISAIIYQYLLTDLVKDQTIQSHLEMADYSSNSLVCSDDGVNRVHSRNNIANGIVHLIKAYRKCKE